ncbi:histone-lysine N-methyltransferase SETDB1-A [Plectropomus leopardus]|uniref:histone-lysine N-methyltransferase SETDB1-A n=1 Tax=Plectropomus leopardus TaxID=160734 RepID=UPI001C4B1B7B|nr:histone-lysine N-methyltransferase SETDB1-A [Plectropomus leopardus]
MEVDEMRMPELQETKERVEIKIKTDPDEERDDDNMCDSPCGSVPSTNETPGKETHMEDGSDSLSLIKKAVVVLTRLPEYKISALRPPTPQQFYSEDESLSSSDSDMQWEPEDDSSDSDFSLAQNKQKPCKHAKNDTTKNNNNNNSSSSSSSEPGPIIVSSAFAHSSNETTKVRPNLPEEEVKVDMIVLARKRSMRWQRGKIVDIVTREDGRLKYKVCFEEKGKSLVSGHHIAFDSTPKLEQLYVGARVVVRCQDNKFRFRPGVLAELPSRKNRLRFLIFLDDHTPVYVGLPLFHLVCRPQENVLDDVPDSPHKSFMTQYLKDWPYPHLTPVQGRTDPQCSRCLEVDGEGKKRPCNHIGACCFTQHTHQTSVVIMEGDEMEMSTEELQKWIRKKVKKNDLFTSDVLQKCKLLQSVLDRREKQAALFLKLCESVSACEAVVKKLYSMLGWEYRETDSDDEDNASGNIIPNSPTPPGPTPKGSENLKGDNGKKIALSVFRKRKLVVVLNRLSTSEIRSLLSWTTQNKVSEDEFSDSSGSDMEWEPEHNSSDSGNSLLSSNRKSSKRRKMDKMSEKLLKSPASPNASTKSNATKTSTLQASANTDAKVNETKTSSASTNAKVKKMKTSTPQASASTDAETNVKKTSAPTSKDKESRPVVISCLRQTSDKDTKTPPSVPQVELSVNMDVVARKKDMRWLQGKITEMITTEDGKLKYQIYFEDKRKKLLSGHHIAFNFKPKVEELYVGARVAVKRKADQCHFSPGIMAELPSRKNRMRFLVFIDDHKPVYVGLPLLRLVSRPLKDPLDDIKNDTHKDFLKQYINDWPYPRQTQYKEGQMINAEFDGVLQKCEVQTIDCSLMQVLILKNQRKEWIYKGSTYLQHISKLTKLQEEKREEEQEEMSPTVKE